MGDKNDAELDDFAKSRLSKSRMYLIPCLRDNPLRTTAGEKRNLHKMYSKLKERYATVKKAKRVQLQTEIYPCRFDGSLAMLEYIERIELMVIRFEGMGSKINESMQVAILLKSLTSISQSPYGVVIT